MLFIFVYKQAETEAKQVLAAKGDETNAEWVLMYGTGSNLWNCLIFIHATYADLFKVLLFSQEFEQLVKTNYMLGNPCQLCYYKLIAWLFWRLAIKWPLTLRRFVELWCQIPQTSRGLRGHLITNLPQAMLLLLKNKPDVITLSETWLDKDILDEEIDTNQYNL